MKKKGFNRDVYRSLVLVTQFGINMLVPTLSCLLLGVFLDRKLGTSFLAILLFFVGALAGFTSVYKLAKRFFGKDDHDRKI